MAGRLAERGISQRVGAKTERVEAGRVVLADGGEEPFDLLIAVPPHRPPAVVADSGLAAGHGWIAVDPGTLATSHEGVYAVGDVNLIPLANGLPLPKAGVMAELQGTARRPRDRGRAARRGAAGAVRRQRLLPDRDRRRLGGARRGALVRGARARRHDRRAERGARGREGGLRDRAPAALVRQLSLPHDTGRRCPQVVATGTKL